MELWLGVKCRLILFCISLVIVNIAFTTNKIDNKSSEYDEIEQSRKTSHHDPDDRQIQFLIDALSGTFPGRSENSRRELTATTTPYECNEVIATIHPNQVSEILNASLMKSSPDSAMFLTAIFAPRLKYGVQVKTVCASCSSVEAISEKESNNAEYKRYCDKDVYGYDIQQSGLVAIPLVVDENDSSGNSLVDFGGALPGFIYSRYTTISRYAVPSLLWPTNGDDHQSIEILFCLLATATGGTVSFAPDFMGYGLSDDSARGYIVRNSYSTTMLPLWMKVKHDLSITTNSKTTLANAAFLQGYSEGGYASVAIAEGLHRALGVEIVQVKAGGAPFRLMTTFIEMVRNFKEDEGGLTGFWNIAVLIGTVFSSTNPTVANYETGQNFLNDQYNDPSNPELYFVGWLEKDGITAFEINTRLLAIVELKGLRTENLLSEIWNPALISFLQGAIDAGVDNPCTPSYSGYEVGVNDKFCEAFAQNDLIDVLHNVNYPVEVCHGNEDKLVSYKNIPDVSQNPDYLEVVSKSGGHITAGAACLSGGLLFLASSKFLNYRFVPETDVKGAGRKNDSAPTNGAFSTKNANKVQFLQFCILIIAYLSA